MSVPSHFGRYRVLRPLATGEMGVVYLAEDPLIGRQVAIKGIRFDPYSDDEEIQRLQERFDQEIQIAGTFSHSNIVTLYDVGRQSGRSFIAMEYVDGRNLRAELQANGPLPADRAVQLVMPLCRALSYAHERGVVHRDIKPTNILVSSEGVPKITDFGVARLFGSTLTHAGKIFGTPAYMSPEQAVGGKLTGASDQFAIAAVLYELLTGERPFKGESPTAVIYEVIESEPIPPHEVSPLVPTAISAAIMRGMAKEPAKRFPSCDALADALKDALAWSKANPELAYLDDMPGGANPDDETTLVNWRAAVTRVRQGGEDLLTALTEARLAERAQAAMNRVVENPPSLLTIAAATVALAALLTAVTWGATHNGATNPITPPGGTPGLAASAEPAAGDLPDRERGVSRGSTSHDLDSEAAPAAGVLDGTAAADGKGAAGGHDRGAGAAATNGSLAGTADELAAGERRSFTVASRPEGAAVMLDGEPLGAASPVSIGVRPGIRHVLRLEKEGYEPLSWAFTLEDLSPAHLASGQLYFPLQPVAAIEEEQIAAPAGASLLPLVVTVADAGGADGEPSSSPPDTLAGGPPPSPANVRRVRAPADTPTPEKLQHVEPSLPANTDLDGVVVLEIEVSARGNVVQARVIRGLDPVADRAALDAVVRWKYRPTELSGTPVHVVMTVTLPMRQSD